MKIHAQGLRFCERESLLLVASILLTCCAVAQSSPPPVITDFDNTSLPGGYNIGDTTFCKGQVITIHGQDFKKATSGESWDTTWVVIGMIAPQVLSITSQFGGNDDRIVCRIPPFYVEDTCLQVRVIKKTVQGANNYFYTAFDTICVTGDRASVGYGAAVFCLGDTNPFPSISVLPPTAAGGFCCRSGAPGFWVNPATGEIPLHVGAVGAGNQFLYVTNHPWCADTVAFDVDIRAVVPGFARINGLSSISICQSSGPVMADTATLWPSAGIFRSPTGLAMMNPLVGMFDPALSPVGLHSLWWVPITPCYDSVEILVEILPVASAVVGYPSLPLNMGVPTLCQGAATVWPSFTTGSAGGNFFATPAGLSLGLAGDISAANSAAGVYTISYASAGACADTVLALGNLHVDSTADANFSLPAGSYCSGGSLAPLAVSGGGTWEVLNDSGMVVFATGIVPVSIAAAGFAAGIAYATANPYQLQYRVGGFCADTFSVPFLVVGNDDPAFTYPPNGNFCIGDADPWPLVSGNGGGSFFAVTPSTVVDLDGRLHLGASGAGVHNIRYITAGACPDSLDVAVNVFGSASAVFAYAASLFCSADTNPLPVLLGTPGGLFSGDSGIVVDSTSGTIHLGQSLPGIWNVTYTLAGSCQAQFTQTVQISATDSLTAIAFQPDHHCQSGPNPFPVLLGDSIGSFIAGGGIVFSNTDRGQLDLSAMVPGGPYVVYYDIDNRCAVDVSDSIWIDLADDPGFSYPQPSYCEGGVNALPDSIAMPGGSFGELTASLIFANAGTGEIDLGLSLPGGPYFVQYTTAGPCPESSVQQVTVLPKPYGARLEVTPDTVFCAGEAIAVQAMAVGAVAWRWFRNGMEIPEVGDHLVSSGHAGWDTLRVAMENLQGCSDSVSVTLHGLEVPQISLAGAEAVTNATGTAAISVALETNRANTVVDWTASGRLVADFAPASGSTTTFEPGDLGIVEFTARVATPYDLGKVQVSMHPRNLECGGDSLKVWVGLTPDTLPVFVPEVMIPNGDGQNDTWMITCRAGVDPAAFRMLLFNSAGGMVLEMDGLHQDFDGGNLPDGVYWWVLEDRASGKAVQSGGLTIRRK